MSNNSPSVTRRNTLKTFITSGIIGVSGCTTRDDKSSPHTGSRDTNLRQPTGSQTGSRTGTATPDRTTTSPSEDATPWSKLDLTGSPENVNDPNWRMIGHDTGHTFHNPHADGPSDDPTVRWTFDVGGSYWDQHLLHYPLIVDGTVYSNVVREGERGGLVAIDAETGESETIIETEQYLWKPTIVGETLYTVLDGSIAAFDLTNGSKIWQTESLFSWPGPPIYADGTVVTGRSGVVIAFDATTGERQWKVGENDWDSSRGHPAIVDGMVIHTGMQKIHDLETGRPRGELPAEISYPAIHSNTVFGLSFADKDPLTRYAIDWETLQTNWAKPDDKKNMGGFGTAFGETYLSVETEDVETFTAIARTHQTGETVWQTSLGESSPLFVASNGKTAFLMDSMFPVIAVDLQTNQVVWEFTPDGDTVRGSGLALADDLLVVSDGSGKLWALE